VIVELAGESTHHLGCFEDHPAHGRVGLAEVQYLQEDCGVEAVARGLRTAGEPGPTALCDRLVHRHAPVLKLCWSEEAGDAHVAIALPRLLLLGRERAMADDVSRWIDTPVEPIGTRQERRAQR
jgi:hypothetical protein